MVIYWYSTKHFGFFKKIGVPEAPGTFPFGSNQSWKVWTGKVCALKSVDDPEGLFVNDKFYGIYSFGQRQLVVKDVELCKLIAIKDADHFIDRMTFGQSYKESKEEVDKLFGLFLTNLTGDAWKKMRNLASPVFTSGKLKLMAPHINKCAVNMTEVLEAASKTGEVLDAKEMYGKFTLDSIATSGFGIESNSYKDPENSFRINAMKLVRDPKYASVMDIPKFIIQFIFPKIASSLGITLMNKKCTEFFINIVRKTMETRRETKTRRNDIIDIFLDELDKDHKQDTFTKEELELGFVSTAILFFFAGFDTTSTTLSIVVHALMHHQDVQDKLRAEIEEVLGDDEEVTADHLKEMKIIEVVIHESMRRYFPFAIQRVCTKDYKIPDTNITIPKGLNINLVPKKEDCFENPEKFDLENFTESEGLNKFGFTGFGQGPRNCIGMRYALQTLKIAIIHTVRKFKLVKCDVTTDKDELFFSIANNGFKGGIKFKVEKLD